MEVNLVMFKGNGGQRTIPLPSSVTIIGRRRSCDLQIPLTSISKKHCQLNITDNVLRIRDLGSRNGTRLNGKRITEAVVQAGDYINIGPVSFALQIDGNPETIKPPPIPEKTKAKKEGLKDTADEQFANVEDLELGDSTATAQGLKPAAEESGLGQEEVALLLDDSDIMMSDDSGIMSDDSGITSDGTDMTPEDMDLLEEMD